MTGGISAASNSSYSGIHAEYWENQNSAGSPAGLGRYPGVDETGGIKDSTEEDNNLKPEKADTGPNRPTPQEQDQVRMLMSRDSQVRSHEAAHLAAGGSLVSGGASYSFQKGPDGKFYAVGGEVQIDTSPGSNPQETLSKARQIRAAALAPANPSPQDLKVAAATSNMEASAMREIQNATAESKRPESTDPDENTVQADYNGDYSRNFSKNLENVYLPNTLPAKPSVFEFRV